MSDSVTILAGSEAVADTVGRLQKAAKGLGVEAAVELWSEAPTPASISVGDVPLGEAVEDWEVEAAVLKALDPSHVLFLCVANSARSQLAEGIARSVAPTGVRVSSAGSEPTAVRPQAVAVMEEIGLDITDHHSKGLEDVEGRVDAVITLCAEEACPAWLGDAWRLHWPLPDPAGAGATEEEELDAFRRTRDELRRRLGVLFGG